MGFYGSTMLVVAELYESAVRIKTYQLRQKFPKASAEEIQVKVHGTDRAGVSMIPGAVTFVEVFSNVIRQLERAGLEYMVVGSIASAYYGEPRLTKRSRFGDRSSGPRSEKMVGVVF